MKTTYTVLLLAAVASGCISVKTESEVKPIHITMDVNLKVDRELEKTLDGDSQSRRDAKMAEVKSLLDRRVAGVNNHAMLEPRSGATDEDRILIAEDNARRQRRIDEIAKSSGVAVEAVQKRHAKLWQDRLPAGSGIWYQDNAGKWKQR